MTAKKPAAAAPAVVEMPPRSDKQPGFFRRLSPLWRVISALVAAISLVTGVIAVVPIFTRDATNFGSLRLEAADYGAALEFGVPPTVDFTSFPSGVPGACDTAQQAWLESHGARIHTTVLIGLRNVASEGAMLSLNRFRGIGETVKTAPLVKVVCDPTGGSADNLQAARLLISDPTQVAYFDKSAFGQTQEGIPDSPVAWNLAPGETGQIVMVFFPTASFTGRLQLTAMSGTESQEFPISVGASDELTAPSLVRGGVAFLRVDGGLICLQIEGAETVPCDIANLLGG